MHMGAWTGFCGQEKGVDVDSFTLGTSFFASFVVAEVFHYRFSPGFYKTHKTNPNRLYSFYIRLNMYALHT